MKLPCSNYYSPIAQLSLAANSVANYFAYFNFCFAAMVLKVTLGTIVSILYPSLLCQPAVTLCIYILLQKANYHLCPTDI